MPSASHPHPTGDVPATTGALLLDLPGGLKRFDPRRSRVFWVRPRNPEPVDPKDLLASAAEHQHRTRAELLAEVEVSNEELRQPVLG